MAYTDTQGYKDLYNHVIGNTGPGGYSWNDSNTSSKLGGYADTFSGLFQSLVGRAPTDTEYEQFFKGVGNDILNSPEGLSNTSNTELNNATQAFIGSRFQQQAKDTAMQQLQAHQGQANDLANLYRQQGQQALDSTSKYLLDYQNQLFNRLQPQIMTSLQAQGLLNTGGLNEALAGAQKDLAGQAQGYLADANLQMQNQANQIAFGGAAAPYYYQQANIMNQLPYLQSMGQNAMNFNNQNYFNNQAFAQQVALQNNYFKNMQDMQPTMLNSLGHSFVDSFGKSAGQMASQMPFAAMQSFGGPGMAKFGGAMS